MNTQEALLFTPAAVLDLLSKLEELEGYEISITETPNNTLKLYIGENGYELQEQSVIQVETTEETVDAVEQAVEEAYEEISEVDDELLDPVEGGLITELGKTLLVGGMVRLLPKLLT